MFRQTLKHPHSRGQAMIESIIALLLSLVLFFLLFDFLEAIRSKIFVEYAAAKCARGRALGYNDFHITKIARIATMPVSGKCLTKDDNGNRISPQSRIERIGPYLASEYEAQANVVLDFELWREGNTVARATDNGSEIIATVTQYRPTVFRGDFHRLINFSSQSPLSQTPIRGEAKIEPHYKLYLQ